jgi:cyanophycinase-like exopeptidase
MESYKTMLNRYGASPKHITVHVDNYLIHSDPNTSEGKNNLEIIAQADVIIFNGGDQTRHLRCWMNDDATPNALLNAFKKRVLND